MNQRVFKLRVILACIFLFNFTPVYSAWYQVEVIVFEHINPDADGEQWLENPGLPDRGHTIELMTREFFEPEDAASVNDTESTTDGENPAVEPRPYHALADDDYRLKGVFRVLRLSSDYRPLYHVAWQQPGLEQDSALAVRLEKYKENKNDEHGLPPELSEIQIEEEFSQALEPIFDGNIKLRSSRFLHVDVDFAFFPESLATSRLTDITASNRDVSINGEAADYVRLTESRKIKLNEMHYFDHPFFGVIVQVSRLNISKSN